MSHLHHPTLLHNRLPYFGRTGLVRNGLVAEYRFDESKNLLKYSQQFDNAAWTKTDCAIAANDTAAPDGTTTADKVTLTVGAAQSCVQSVAVAASTAYVFSIWVKLGTATALKYAIYNVSGSADIIAATSYGATTSWVRYAIPFTTPAGCTSVSIRPVKDSAQDNGTTAWIWGAQLEAGSVARTYYPTMDKQLLMDYSRPRKNLLLPNQANACEDGTTGGFTEATSTITPSAGEVDEWQGTYCIKAVSGNVSEGEGFYTGFLYGLKPATTYTASAYVRGAAGGETIRLHLRESTDAEATVYTTGSDTLTLTTGWQRVTVSCTFGATGRSAKLLILTPTKQSATFYVDGLQLEEGSTATAWEAPPNIGYCGSTTGADTNDPTYTGQGASFTTDDAIDCPALDLSALTVMAVCYPTSLYAELSTGSYIVSEAYFAGDATTRGWGLFFYGGGVAGDRDKVRFDVADASGTINTVKTDVNRKNEWHVFTGVYRDSSYQEIHKDLSLVDVDTSTVTLAPAGVIPLRIGGYSAYTNLRFYGLIAYIAVWNRALTRAEIAQNYNYLKSYLLRERGIQLS